jgi:hypothetical protein
MSARLAVAGCSVYLGGCSLYTVYPRLSLAGCSVLYTTQYVVYMYIVFPRYLIDWLEQGVGYCIPSRVYSSLYIVFPRYLLDWL